MWRKRNIAFQFHSLQPVSDIVSAPWRGHAVLFRALVGHAAQEQFPAGAGAQEKLQACSLGGRTAHPCMNASCKLVCMWCSRQCFGSSWGLAGPLKD